MLAPGTALAANECTPIGVDPSANGSSPDIFTCTASVLISTDGVTYSSAGPLTVTSTNALNVGVEGIDLVGNTTDSVTLNTTAGIVTGTAGEVIEVRTGSGAIDIATAGITGSGTANVTYGILAVSTTGPITIVNNVGNVNVNNTTVGAAQQAAIRAESTSGAVSVTTGTTSGTVTGRVYGIQAVTGGAGTVTVNANNAVALNTTAGVGVAAIDTVAATGATNITLGGTTGVVNGQAGAAIRTNSTTGAQTITINAGRTAQVTAASTGALNLTSTGAKTVTSAGTINGTAGGVAILVNSGSNFTLNNTGSITGRVNVTGTGATTITSSGTLNAGATNAAVVASGTTFTLTNSGSLTGRLTLSGITGASTVTNSGTWSTAGANAFSAGASTLTNSGTLTAAAGTTFTSLETFNNSGTIALGNTGTLNLGAATFTGSGASLITVGVTDTGSGQLLLPGGTTAGVTGVRVTGAAAGDTSLFSDTPIVLIDVAGGTTAAGHFLLDAGSTNFVNDPMLGGVIATDGFFARALRFNDADQHVLISVPRSQAFEYVPAMHEVLSVWHTTSDLVTGRQADLRDPRTRGMWIRLIGDRTERDYAPSFSSSGNTFDFDSSYTLYTGAAIVGFDVFSGTSQAGDFALGLHGGLVRSRMEMSNSDTTHDMDGVTLGVYGGLNNGPLTLDGTLNANLLSLDHNDPTLGDTNTNVISIGGRAEAGWLWALSDAFYVQPLVTGAYVRSEIKDVFPKAYEVAYDDVVSARAALGLRVGSNTGTAMGPVGFWLTGRVWREFADEASMSISATDAPDFVIADDLSGDFQELTGGLTLDVTDGMRLFLSGGAKFHDELDNYNASVGLRWRW